MSDLSQKTPYGNLKYTQQKKKKQNQTKWAVLSAEDAPSWAKAAKQCSEPSQSLLCPQRWITFISWTCLCWGRCQMSYFHLDLSFKKCHNSHKSRQWNPRQGLTHVISKNTFPTFFCLWPFSYQWVSLLSCLPQSQETRTAPLTHPGEAAELDHCVTRPPQPFSLKIKEMVLTAVTKPAASCELHLHQPSSSLLNGWSSSQTQVLGHTPSTPT